MMVRRVNHGLKGHRSFSAVLYKEVDRRSTDSIISWSQNGKSFIVWNVEEFCRVIIWKFALTEFQFFAYRLKTFGFRKVESGKLEYANDDFVRGKPELIAEIDKRRKESFAAILRMCEGPPEATSTELKKTFSMATKRKEKEKALSNDLSNLTL